MTKKVLFIILMLFPTIVFASSGEDAITVMAALGMEAFITIHMSLMVLKPLSKMFARNNPKKLFWVLFVIRAMILLFCNLILPPEVAMLVAIVDFISVFIGAFIVVPVCSNLTKKNRFGNSALTNNTENNTSSIKGIELRCSKCSNILAITDKFCPNCGIAIENNNISVVQNDNAQVNIPPKVRVLPSNFDKIYSLTEDEMLEEFIKREFVKCGIDKYTNQLPLTVLKKKKVLNLLFCILVFIYIILIFFHFPIVTYIIGIIILVIFFKLTRRYDLVKYLKKQIKERPNEKILNIIMKTKETFVTDNSKTIFIICLISAIVLPLLIFLNPKIMYEKNDYGYSVRFYTFGLTNFTKATIPDSYKGKPVTSLRGNTFSNMPLLKKVELPNTITEIRGQAFKNDISLANITLPNKLTYLGGGAFYNCKSLTSIIIPDSLTEMGGETFYNSSSLREVTLSNSLMEIRGDTFYNCKSLTSINIPDSITRIGGHAFYNASSLSKVTFTENSKLEEIGSSAFRLCSNLDTITLPYGVNINERAFKESPTTINYFNQNNYYNEPDLTDYNTYNYSFRHIYINDIFVFESKQTETGNKELSITLESIENGQFEFKYNNEEKNWDLNFTLSNSRPYIKLDDKLIYMTDYDDSSVNVRVYSK